MILGEYKAKLAMLISEPDKGIYDALNKGIRMATGDVIGILHSDEKKLADEVSTSCRLSGRERVRRSLKGINEG